MKQPSGRKERAKIMFIIMCSWCNREINRFPGEDEISHGICRRCYEKTVKDMRSLLSGKVELIKSPIPVTNTLAEQF
jgi:hypothetical protein